ncbi:CMP/dCMP-type deaminase domain-containing protein [Mycena kentingensis (nom. inval.)]|nr:CMP/dCMP-type deaminase domain-containing protein [Mycena kentingensis (nom. inval.)]
MNKPQYYLSQCVEAASKSPMYYTLGSAIVKGGKVISTGYNHQRPQYDTPGSGKPLSMHAEMASIFNATLCPIPAGSQHAAALGAQHKKKAAKNVHGNYHNYRANNEEQGQGQQGQHGLDSQRRNPSRVPYAVPRATMRRTSHPHHHPHHHHHALPEEEYPYVYETETEAVRRGVGTGTGAGSKGRKRSNDASSRRKFGRVSGADLYVVRVTRSGEYACAKPCWRCIEWCAWAGIKRIFHWGVIEQRWVCLKVGDASAGDWYETLTDTRVFTGQIPT